jgi:NadR type nicotinamide-nucleotide adenylyltransferase
MSLIKVVVIGPESTGKSSLCAELAAHYNTQWCPEYAREHLTVHGKSYGYDDLLTIAQKQLALEDKHTFEALNQEQEILFIDTDMYVMKVWCEYVFQKCHHYILEQITQRKYDLYLLCDTDLPWVKDELREYPDDGPRKELFQIYKDLLINQSTPFVIINGNYQERLHTAIKAVDQLQGVLV